MTESELVETEQALGREIDRSNARAFASLNEIPSWLIEDLRILASTRGRIAAVRYLAYHCTDRFGFFAPFLQDVVEGGESPSTWRLDRVRRS